MQILFKHTFSKYFLPQNIEQYPHLQRFYEQRNLYQTIILRSKKNVITSSSNILLKNGVIQSKFLLNRYQGQHLSLLKYIKILGLLVKSKIEKRKGTYIWICTSSTDNYYHWIIDVLIKTVGLKKIYSELPPLLISEEALKYPFIIDSLKYHQIKYELLYSSKFYKIENVITPITEKKDRVFNVENLQFAKQLMLSKISPQSTNFKKTYISRRNANKRRIINEEEVITILISYGIEIVETEQLSYQQQLSLFSQTNLLISIHGAGLVNQVFMPQNSAILEIRHPNISEQPLCFFDISKALNNNYYLLLGEPTNPTESAHTADLHVSTAELDQLIMQMIGTAQPL